MRLAHCLDDFNYTNAQALNQYRAVLRAGGSYRGVDYVQIADRLDMPRALDRSRVIMAEWRNGLGTRTESVMSEHIAKMSTQSIGSRHKRQPAPMTTFVLSARLRYQLLWDSRLAHRGVKSFVNGVGYVARRTDTRWSRSLARQVQIERKRAYVLAGQSEVMDIAYKQLRRVVIDNSRKRPSNLTTDKARNAERSRQYRAAMRAKLDAMRNK